MKQIEQTLTSMEVAEMVEKEHHKLMRDIRRYSEQLNESKIGLVDFFQESTYKDSKGEIRHCYNVTKKGCEFIAHKLTGTKGTAFTAKYINRFHKMEDFIKETTGQPWTETRYASKLTRQSETDVIKQLVEYAKAQGSEHAQMLYVTYSKLANKAAGITDRNFATISQLNNLSFIENIILNQIRVCMGQEMHYKEIYQSCKKQIELFKEIAYFDARLAARN